MSKYDYIVELIGEMEKQITKPDYGYKEFADRIIIETGKVKEMFASEQIDGYDLNDYLCDIEDIIREYDEISMNDIDYNNTKDSQLKRFLKIRELRTLLRDFLEF